MVLEQYKDSADLGEKAIDCMQTTKWLYEKTMARQKFDEANVLAKDYLAFKDIAIEQNMHRRINELGLPKKLI